MATIWTFGDSFTERFNPKYDWSKNYIDWKGYVPKVYGNYISESLNYNLQNLGKAGCDNYTIFETFCNTYPLIKDEDVVIIGWTSTLRFRMVDNLNDWTTFHPKWNNYLKDFDYLSENTLTEMFINRQHSKYASEVNAWIKFINNACDDKKIIHWDTLKGGDGELDTYHFFGMEGIDTETNGEVNDQHFSENGHQQLALDMIDILMNKEKLVKSNKLI